MRPLILAVIASLTFITNANAETCTLKKGSYVSSSAESILLCVQYAIDKNYSAFNRLVEAGMVRRTSYDQRATVLLRKNGVVLYKLIGSKASGWTLEEAFDCY